MEWCRTAVNFDLRKRQKILTTPHYGGNCADDELGVKRTVFHARISRRNTYTRSRAMLSHMPF